MKNSLTPAGIEPATFRFVAQHLNHYATAVPRDGMDVLKKKRKKQKEREEKKLFAHNEHTLYRGTLRVLTPAQYVGYMFLERYSIKMYIFYINTNTI